MGFGCNVLPVIMLLSWFSGMWPMWHVVSVTEQQLLRIRLGSVSMFTRC